MSYVHIEIPLTSKCQYNCSRKYANYTDAQFIINSSPDHIPCSKGTISRQMSFTKFKSIAPVEFIKSIPANFTVLAVAFYKE